MFREILLCGSEELWSVAVAYLGQNFVTGMWGINMLSYKAMNIHCPWFCWYLHCGFAQDHVFLRIFTGCALIDILIGSNWLELTFSNCQYSQIQFLCLYSVLFCCCSFLCFIWLVFIVFSWALTILFQV